MSFPFYISKRYLKSKKDSRLLSFISWITIGGISLGVAIVIIALTILNGFQKVVSEKIIELNDHIKVTAFGDKNIKNYETIIDDINSHFSNDIQSLTPFISKLAIIKSKKRVDGVTIMGISEEKGRLGVANFIVDGKFKLTDSDEKPAILIGKKLAEKLLIKTGDIITIFSIKNNEVPSLSNPPAIRQFIVSGIYESGMSEYDDLYAYINLATAQRLFGMEGEISGFNIKIKNVQRIEKLSEELQDFLHYPFYVRSIYKIHQNIFTWLDLQKKPIPIILGLIIIVAVFNIIGTILMLVLEKISEIGILKSLGTNRKSITKIFLIQGMYLSIIGILTGNILAFVLSIIQKEFHLISLPGDVYFISEVPIAVDFSNYLLISVITFFLCISASFIPSFIASRLNPISAIRFE